MPEPPPEHLSPFSGEAYVGDIRLISRKHDLASVSGWPTRFYPICTRISRDWPAILGENPDPMFRSRHARGEAERFVAVSIRAEREGGLPFDELEETEQNEAIRAFLGECAAIQNFFLARHGELRGNRTKDPVQRLSLADVQAVTRVIDDVFPDISPTTYLLLLYRIKDPDALTAAELLSFVS